MDWKKISDGPYLQSAFREYDRQHLAEYHSRCPVCVAEDDPPTGLSGTMEPYEPKKAESIKMRDSTAEEIITALRANPPILAPERCECNHSCHKKRKPGEVTMYDYWKYCTECGLPLVGKDKFDPSWQGPFYPRPDNR